MSEISNSLAIFGTSLVFDGLLLCKSFRMKFGTTKEPVTQRRSQVVWGIFKAVLARGEAAPGLSWSILVPRGLSGDMASLVGSSWLPGVS